jgi:hypothetical protein
VDNPPPDDDEPQWGDERWWHHAIPIALGFAVLATAMILLYNFLHADW